MKKIYLSGIAFVMAAALLFTGCKNNDVTPTSSQLSFAMGSDNPVATLASANTGAPGSGMTVFAATGTQSIAWTTATANISQFKFEAKKDGTPIEIKASGIANVDLLATLPTTINTTIANGKYTEVEVRVVLAKQTGTGAFPFVLKGVYTTKAGTTFPVEFDFNEDLELKASANDIIIDGKNDLLAKLSLHLSQLLANVTAQEIDQTNRPPVNGVTTILINSTTNTTLYNKIKTDLMLAGGSTVVKK